MKLPLWRLICGVAIFAGLIAVLLALTPVSIDSYRLGRYVRTLGATTTPDEVLRSEILARARDRSVVLVALVEHRDDWPVPADVALEVTSSSWRSDGRLVERVAQVQAVGRGTTGRPRLASLWLPNHEGSIALAG